jgi:hypothetical protein
MKTTGSTMLDALKKAFRDSLKPTIKVSILMLKVFIPLSFITLLLRQLGVLDLLAPLFAPFMSLIGLPGEAAVTILAGFTNSIYAALATTAAVDLTPRQVTILGVVLGVAHSLFLETGIMVSLRMATMKIALFRLVVGVAAGIILNAVLPEIGGTVVRPDVSADAFSWINALLQVGTISLQIVVIIFIITFSYELLTLWKGAARFRERMGFLSTTVGMSDRAAAPWIAGFIIGITIGAAMLYQFNEKQQFSHKDACLISVFLSLAHAIIEDTVLFALIGGNIWWILLTRVLLAVLIVRILAFGNLYRHFLWIGLPKDHSHV